MVLFIFYYICVYLATDTTHNETDGTETNSISPVLNDKNQYHGMDEDTETGYQTGLENNSPEPETIYLKEHHQLQ